MDIALNRQEQIISYQGKAYNMIGRGLLIATATAFVGTLFYSPLLSLVFSLGGLGLIFYMQRLSGDQLRIAYYAFTSLLGYGLASYLLRYSGEQVFQAFALTGGTYFITSWYGQRTKTDLSQFSGMLTFALIGLIIASVFSMFFASTMLSWIINIGGVIIFSVLNAVDSQQLKYVSSDDEAVMASVGIYLNVINLFSFFMSIIGMSSDEQIPLKGLHECMWPTLLYLKPTKIYYVALPLATFCSITLFGDWPDMISQMSIVLIAGAGIFNVFREKIQTRTIVLNRLISRNS